MTIFARTTIIAPVALWLPAADAEAPSQLLASEASSVSQTVDGTKLTVTYSRPRARGRRGLFGTQDTALFHTTAPKARPGQVRFNVSREKTPFAEVLTWSIPAWTSTGMTVLFQWDTVSVPLAIKVRPSYSTTVGADVAGRMVGRYQLHFEPMPEPPKDTTVIAESEEKPVQDVTLTVRHEGGALRAVMDPPMFRTEPGYTDWILLPGKGDWFKLARVHNGELTEILDFIQLQFDSAGPRAKGFEVRLTNDVLVGKGTRLP